MLTAGAARAQDGSVNVSTAADSAKLGAEFRSELLYDNHQLNKEDGAPTPKATTNLEVQTARLKLRGNLNKETEYAFRINVLRPAPVAAGGGPLDYGYGTHWFTDMFGWSFGKMKVLQGGWDQADGGFRDHAVGVYRASLLPFRDYEAMTAIHLKVAGKLTLQVMNDANQGQGDATNIDASKTVAEWNKGSHPTYDLGWAGDFNGIMPLIDFGAYDNQKSMWFDVGIKAKLAGVDASLDFSQNSFAHKRADAAGKAKAVKDVGTNIALRAGYEVPGVVKPILYFATYDNKQGADSVTGAKDLKFNSRNPTTGVKAQNDNGQTIGVSADVLSLGKNWSPYLALVNQSGKWADPKKPDSAKSYSDMTVRFGALGEF
jgi:hypothetical protein